MSKIFREGGERVFDPSYLPHDLPHREYQLNQISETLIEGVINGHYAVPILYGDTGTGKTTTLRKALLKIKEEIGDIRVESIVLNATTHRTAYTVIRRIASKIIPIPERGYGIDEIILKLCDRLDIEELSYIVAIDDSDELIRVERGKILDILTRIDETYDRRLIFPIIVVRKIEILNILPQHIKSKLGGYRIEFKPYDKEQLKDILKERIVLGLDEKRITENAIKLSTLATEKIFGGNARELLNMIYKSGKTVEYEGGEAIKAEHVRQSIYDSYLKSIKPKLSIDRNKEIEYYKIIWPFTYIAYHNNDVYDLSENLIKEAYEIYQKSFMHEKIDYIRFRKLIEELVLTNTNIFSKDDDSIVFFTYPAKTLYEGLRNILFSSDK